MVRSIKKHVKIGKHQSQKPDEKAHGQCVLNPTVPPWAAYENLTGDTLVESIELVTGAHDKYPTKNDTTGNAANTAMSMYKSVCLLMVQSSSVSKIKFQPLIISHSPLSASHALKRESKSVSGLMSNSRSAIRHDAYTGIV